MAFEVAAGAGTVPDKKYANPAIFFMQAAKVLNI